MESRYHQVYARWKADPQGFWGDAARELSWFKSPERIFDPDRGIYGRWFPDAECNTCYNCVDRHVEQGRPGQNAII